MKITIIRGQNQIGGSIIEVSYKDTRIIFDVGQELDEPKVHIPKVEGLFQGKASLYQAVFISHYHSDHIGLYDYVNKIPVYMGKKCFCVYKAANEYLGHEVKDDIHFFSPMEVIEIGSIKITPVLCDHSAFDSYMFYIQGGDKSVLYTGDFRSNGRKNYDAFLSDIFKVDALIIEGTVLSRNSNTINATERELEETAVKSMQHTAPVFFLMAATNIDRIVTAYRSSKRCNRIFLEDLYMASITSAIGGSIPNPKDFSDIRVFAINGDLKSYEQLNKYGSQKIGKAQIAKSQFSMYVRTSMRSYLEKLSDLVSFNNGTLFYSMWKGYVEKQDIKEFLNFMENKGVHIVYLHTSGHADYKAIDQLIKAANPQYIIPVHTNNAKWFLKYGINVLLDTNVIEI